MKQRNRATVAMVEENLFFAQYIDVQCFKPCRQAIVRFLLWIIERPRLVCGVLRRPSMPVPGKDEAPGWLRRKAVWASFPTLSPRPGPCVKKMMSGASACSGEIH